MVDISNKALAFVLLASVVVSLGGTFFVLNNVGSEFGPTGFAPTSSGMVNITVATTISITTDDSPGINFGGCSLNQSNPIHINSMATENTSTYCLSYTGTNISNISVRNNGNVIVNVSIATNNCAPGAGNVTCLFLNYSSAPSIASNGLFQYSTMSAGLNGNTGGCASPNTSWTSFNGTHAYRACTNLNHVIGTNNSFITDFRLRLPQGLGTGQQTATLTFTAFEG